MAVKAKWVIFSSSSGKTFEKAWEALSETSREACLGLFVDRDCEALSRGRALLGEDRVHRHQKGALFERDVMVEIMDLKAQFPNEKIHVLLCGFFGILSKDFLSKLPCAVVNTHPSLLPAFPGLDVPVHKKAFESVPVSGFSIHLVNEELDGGPILFQDPVFIGDCQTWEESRARVRAHESRLLGQVWERILDLPLEPSDRHFVAKDLMNKYGISWSSFSSGDIQNGANA